MFVLFVMRSYLIEVRGLKPDETANKLIEEGSYLIEVRGLKLVCGELNNWGYKVVSYRGTWVETPCTIRILPVGTSYLIEVRGLKPKNRSRNLNHYCRIL